MYSFTERKRNYKSVFQNIKTNLKEWKKKHPYWKKKKKKKGKQAKKNIKFYYFHKL